MERSLRKTTNAWPALAATSAVALVLSSCSPSTSDDQAAEEGWEWPNADPANTRVANTSIDSTNIDQLGVAWTFDIPGISAYGAAASNPLISGETVYFQDLASNVFALGLDSGEVRWEKRYDTAVVGPNGPGLGDDKLVVHSGARNIAALDPETGDELWAVELEHATGAQQPVVWNGTVYTGTAAGAVAEDTGDGEIGLRGYAAGSSGFAYALDAETGETRWRFQVVKPGFWGDPETNSGGGIWYPPAIDEERGLTYWGTGNPAPFPGIVGKPNGSSRPGPNLYTNSILALEADDGALAWYHQVKPYDIFDLDFQAPRILATVPIGGDDTDIVIGSGKLGRVVAFDRDRGQKLWDRPVGRHQNDDLEAIPVDGPITVFPGVLGGVETPMAFADETIYAPVVNLASTYDPTAFGATTGTEAVGNIESRLDFSAAESEIVAIDATNGRIRWTTDLDDAVFSGATILNDLVLVATFDGMIRALDRADGEILWSWKAPAGINAWPAVSGDTIVWPAGSGNNPKLIALRLGGAEDGSASPTPTAISSGADGETLSLEAERIAFDTESLVASSGTEVRIRFTTHDQVPHNFALYRSEDAREEIFVGDTITGPDETTNYLFTAPSETGAYFFRCDVHPNQMTGTFTVI